MGQHDRFKDTRRAMTPEMVAERWKCSAETVRKMVKRGELRGFRVGRMIRITQNAIEDYECQQSVSDACAEDSASTGMRQRPESAAVISLRHAPERKQKPKAETDI
ncbi:hypothetical protein B6V72_11270 [Thioclava sp. F34-6]|uniref:helix-turn-helix domain-containing protein n=1 Tax=Thioclava sp. F34-6 TaxID=1973003 RepID=UPI000B54019A|nr:helix-turn-helix domain-containing protein [Thioclava sp. F34-6]OWY12474.1 hypothetical protein B6V72_11270 [Thioclava sp. F34-6]